MSNSIHSGELTCPQCRRQLEPDSVFCDSCGARLDQDDQTVLRVTPTSGAAGPKPTINYGSADAHTPGRVSRSQATAALDPLVGAATPNETYLGNRLAYSDVGTNFDPLSNPAYQRALVAQFVATVIAWFLASFLLGVVLGIPFLLITLARGSTTAYGYETGNSSLLSTLQSVGVFGAIYQLLWFALSVVLAVLFWTRKLAVQLTEWMITVDGQGHLSWTALDHMYGVIASRRAPGPGPKVIRLSTERQQKRDYLQLDDQTFTGFVSCFPYGTDLFIGWTFWLNMSPARWLWLHLKQLFRGRGGIYGSLTYDQPKAMRELLHSAVRQGVDIATGEAEATGQGLIGQQGITAVEL